MTKEQAAEKMNEEETLLPKQKDFFKIPARFGHVPVAEEMCSALNLIEKVGGLGNQTVQKLRRKDIRDKK